MQSVCPWVISNGLHLSTTISNEDNRATKSLHLPSLLVSILDVGRTTIQNRSDRKLTVSESSLIGMFGHSPTQKPIFNKDQKLCVKGLQDLGKRHTGTAVIEKFDV